MKFSLILLMLCLSALKAEAAPEAPGILLPSKSDVFVTAIDQANQQLLYSYDLKSDLIGWDLHSKKIIWRNHISDHFDIGFAIASSRKSDWIVTTSARAGCLQIIEARTGKERRRLCVEPALHDNIHSFGSLNVSADDRFIVAGEFGRPTLHVWDTHNGQLVTSVNYPEVTLPSSVVPAPAEEYFNYHVYFSGDGARVGATNLMVFRLIDLKSKKVLKYFGMGSYWPDRTISATALSPDQRFVAASITTLSEESETDSGVKFVVRSTETAKQLLEMPLTTCRMDVRHIEFSWKSDEASILCGNGQFFKVDIASGKMNLQLNLSKKWQGEGNLHPDLWLARHSMSGNHDFLFAAGAGGIHVLKLSK